MRTKHATSVGIVAGLASLTTQALARNSNARNSDAQTPAEPPASLSCSALQTTADGTWARLRVWNSVPRSNPSEIRGAKFRPANALKTASLTGGCDDMVAGGLPPVAESAATPVISLTCYIGIFSPPSHWYP